jgi:dienelactone hydrolase
MRSVVRALIAIGVVLALGAGIFLAWGLTPLGPDDDALAALQSNANVSVRDSGESVAFVPTARVPATGLILYPGGHVDHRSYAPVAQRIAERGYLVVIVRVPLSLAVLGIDRADAVIAANPSVPRWVVGGHSLGGTAAASYARTHPDGVAGLALWASYPAGGDDLSATTLQGLSVYGSNDLVLDVEALNATLPLLPPGTPVRVIEGGNHAQFGNYGLQPGDGTATISAVDQQALVAEMTAGLLGAVESA